nr:cytochrome P450 [Streptomyces dioscori]
MTDQQSWNTDGRTALYGAFKTDAPAQYARLRALGPVHPVELFAGLKGYLVVDHDTARKALTHPALLKDPRYSTEALTAAGFILHQPGIGLGAQMLEADPPTHTRLRRLVAGAFTPRRTEMLAPRIEQIADELINALPASGEADLVEAFTTPLPVTVIAELLGVPQEDRENFRKWSGLALQVTSPHHRPALAGLHALLRRLVEDKRRAPGDDLLSALVTARDEDDGRLSEDELIGTAILLVIAGHDTTVNLLGNAVLALLRHPDQLRLLRANPALLHGAVEEFLRYDTSVERTSNRYAAEDLELGGVLIPRGSVVAVALGSASHDIALPGNEDPAVLDVTRPGGRHMAFGHGIHHCLGAPLARLEARVALGALLSRLPHLELTVPVESLVWIPSGMMRGVLSLPVRYSTV